MLIRWSENFTINSLAYLKSSLEGCNHLISVESWEDLSHSAAVSELCCLMRKLAVSVNTGSDENKGTFKFSRLSQALMAVPENWSPKALRAALKKAKIARRDLYQELKTLVSSAKDKDQPDVLGGTIIQKKRDH